MMLAFAFGSGLVAGLALAVPLGAIGVLLIQEGATRGWIRGAPAAAAVATVDAIYCAAAIAAGSLLAPLVSTWAPWPTVIGGAALVGIATWGVARIPPVDTSTDAITETSSTPSWHRYLTFLGLTAINPATLVYFAALVTGLSILTASPATAAFFVAGVGVGSLSWQLLLVCAGAVLRWRTGPQVRRLTTIIGHSIVGAIGILMIVRSIT
jgi:arginine exporter protein ArgO